MTTIPSPKVFSALGQRAFHGGDSDDAKLFTIVGVVGAVKQAELTEPPWQGAVSRALPDPMTALRAE